MEFSRQEYWSGLPFPSPGYLFNPGIKPSSPTLQADALPFEPPGKTYDLGNAGNLISGSSSFSKPNLDIWNFLVHKMQKTSMQDFKHDLTSMGNECNCLMVRTFFNTTFLGNWVEDFSSPVATAGSSRFVDVMSATF